MIKVFPGLIFLFRLLNVFVVPVKLFCGSFNGRFVFKRKKWHRGDERCEKYPVKEEGVLINILCKDSNCDLQTFSKKEILVMSPEHLQIQNRNLQSKTVSFDH